VENTPDIYVYGSFTVNAGRLSVPPSLVSNGYGESRSRVSNVIIYLHPVRGLRISGAIPTSVHDIRGFTFCFLHEHSANMQGETNRKEKNTTLVLF
jgi:hypothetical protein